MGEGTSSAALSAWTSSSGWSLATTSPTATLTALTSTLSTFSLSACSLISLAIRRDPPLEKCISPQRTQRAQRKTKEIISRSQAADSRSSPSIVFFLPLSCLCALCGEFFLRSHRADLFRVDTEL